MVLLLCIVLLIISPSCVLAAISSSLMRGVFYGKLRSNPSTKTSYESYHSLPRETSRRDIRSIADPYPTTEGPVVHGMCGWHGYYCCVPVHHVSCYHAVLSGCYPPLDLRGYTRFSYPSEPWARGYERHLHHTNSRERCCAGSEQQQRRDVPHEDAEYREYPCDCQRDGYER